MEKKVRRRRRKFVISDCLPKSVPCVRFVLQGEGKSSIGYPDRVVSLPVTIRRELYEVKKTITTHKMASDDDNEECYAGKSTEWIKFPYKLKVTLCQCPSMTREEQWNVWQNTVWAEWDKVILLVYSNSRRFVLLCKRHFVRSNAMLTFSLKRKPGTRDYSWTNWTTRFGIVTMQNNGVFFCGQFESLVNYSDEMETHLNTNVPLYGRSNCN